MRMDPHVIVSHFDVAARTFFLVKPDRVNQPLDDGWLMIINAVWLAVQYFLGVVLIHCGKFDCSNILQLTDT